MKYVFTRNIFSALLSLFRDSDDIYKTDELLEKIKEMLPRLRKLKRERHTIKRY